MKWPELPKVIRTPLKDYKVVVTRDFDKENNDGLCDHDIGRIKIHADLPIEYQWQSLYHEIIHIAEHITGMKPLKDKRNNSAVESLAMGLCMIFACNGWIGDKNG